MARELKLRPFLWVLLAIPGLWILWGWTSGSSTYGEAVSASGLWATEFLIAAMAVTPLRLVFRRGAWLTWLLRHRRDLGVATFAYASGHMVIYLIRKADLALIAHEATRLWLLAGWLALICFLALAVTSNDASVRYLRRAWKRLHRLVYVGAVLVFIHWVLSAFDPTVAYIHLAVLAGLEALRVGLQVRQRVT